MNDEGARPLAKTNFSSEDSTALLRGNDMHVRPYEIEGVTYSVRRNSTHTQGKIEADQPDYLDSPHIYQPWYASGGHHQTILLVQLQSRGRRLEAIQSAY